MSEQEITKLDAARRQLLAAIHIHWYLQEPIAVYSLASNAWEVCDALLQRKDNLRILEEIARTKGSSPHQIRGLINRPRNFIKHADKDPDGVLPDFSHADCDAILLTACVDYMMVSRRSPWIMGLYMGWYSAIYPEKTGDFNRGIADEFFPGLADRTREDQVRAARSAAFNAPPTEVLHNPRNELTDNARWRALRKLGEKLPAR